MQDQRLQCDSLQMLHGQEIPSRSLHAADLLSRYTKPKALLCKLQRISSYGNRQIKHWQAQRHKHVRKAVQMRLTCALAGPF